MFIQSPNFLVYFIAYGTETIGYLILRKKALFHLQSLYLLSQYRGKGIGRMAFAFVRDYCKEHGISKFDLDCHPDNITALAFYEKMGGVIAQWDTGHKNNEENGVRIVFDVDTGGNLDMDRELIQKTEQFLKDTFRSSIYLQEHPDELEYRQEHSYRVANIGKQIAEAEGFDVTDMVIACLLHDISYCQEMTTREEQMGHGRAAAQIARPFLARLGLPLERMNTILYAIAIHVDENSDFEWKRTLFTESVGDADNIDRFDVYRIYETLEYNQFRKLSLADKTEQVTSTLERLQKLLDIKFATNTAVELWCQRIDYYISFYNKLLSQLQRSDTILSEE